MGVVVGRALEPVGGCVRRRVGMRSGETVPDLHHGCSVEELLRGLTTTMTTEKRFNETGIGCCRVGCAADWQLRLYRQQANGSTGAFWLHSGPCTTMGPVSFHVTGVRFWFRSRLALQGSNKASIPKPPTCHTHFPDLTATIESAGRLQERS